MADPQNQLFRPSGSNDIDCSFDTYTRNTLPTGTGSVIRVACSGSGVGWFAVGGSSVEVSKATGMKVYPGGPELFDIKDTDTHYAGIAEIEGFNIQITRGAGEK